MIRTLQVTFYYTDGTNETAKIDGEWEYVTPDTIEETIHDYLCKGKVTTPK